MFSATFARLSVVVALAGLVSGCASTPYLAPAPDLELFNKSEIGFITPQRTTREEIIFRLGNPIARFEDDRILIYQAGFEKNGRVHLYAPRILGATGLQDWEPKTYSLVLVFRPDAVLLNFSLVGSE